ncbi:MAG TPA: hypothetical protein VG246_04060 [Acidimicrobiales bacterium]|nr:hypothetical protein [Acidimicrobiales bacterium]
MSDFRARSFDAPRERPAPSVLAGKTPRGEERRIELRRVTLVVAVKPHCDGCREFLIADLHELSKVDVVVVSAAFSEEWMDVTNDVLVAPELMKELDIRSAPFYVLIDPLSLRVVTEGVVFGPAQVAAEIEGLLRA